MEILEQFFDPGTGTAGQLFWGSLVCIALWEALRPLRPLEHSVLVRWINNIALAVLNGGIIKILTVLLAFDLVLLADRSGFGLLNVVELPVWLALSLGVAWLDFVSYATHRLSHAVPIFWRIHRLHHSDPDVDFSTSRRHHPFETFITTPILVAGLLVSGAPPLALLIWSALSGTLSLFQHGNIRLPDALDRGLRLVLVTPAMHRTHHSSKRSETDSNYGQVFPWWDRMLGTYCARPEGGLTGMTLGLEHFRHRDELFLHRLLLQPFAATKTTPVRQTEIS